MNVVKRGGNMVGRERGTVLVIVMAILAALLAGGAVVVHLQVADLRMAGLVRTARAALYCSEAGLSTARPILAGNMGDWPRVLDADATNNPAWYPISGDLDAPADGVIDWIVTVEDNDDEFSPSLNDPNVDTDGTIFAISTCQKYPLSPRQIVEAINFAGAVSNYRAQAGQGQGGTGNAN
jgi:hypothetical protein